MKYGESFFDIFYLLFAIVSGCVILCKARNHTERLTGLAVLLLGCGDAFHLLPRVLNCFVSADFSAALGVGKLITSLTMSVFYVLLYYVWLGHYRQLETRGTTIALCLLLAARVILCLMPQNGWLQNSGDMTWGILRNIPFVLLGAIVCILYFRRRQDDPLCRRVWLYILLSFLFYIPVAVGAGLVPMLGILMLPKTVCYMLMILAFLRSLKRTEA